MSNQKQNSNSPDDRVMPLTARWISDMSFLMETLTLSERRELLAYGRGMKATRRGRTDSRGNSDDGPKYLGKKKYLTKNPDKKAKNPRNQGPTPKSFPGQRQAKRQSPHVSSKDSSSSSPQQGKKEESSGKIKNWADATDDEEDFDLPLANQINSSAQEQVDEETKEVGTQDSPPKAKFKLKKRDDPPATPEEPKPDLTL